MGMSLAHVCLWRMEKFIGTWAQYHSSTLAFETEAKQGVRVNRLPGRSSAAQEGRHWFVLQACTKFRQGAAGGPGTSMSRAARVKGSQGAAASPSPCCTWCLQVFFSFTSTHLTPCSHCSSQADMTEGKTWIRSRKNQLFRCTRAAAFSAAVKPQDTQLQFGNRGTRRGDLETHFYKITEWEKTEPRQKWGVWSVTSWVVKTWQCQRLGQPGVGSSILKAGKEGDFSLPLVNEQLKGNHWKTPSNHLQVGKGELELLGGLTTPGTGSLPNLPQGHSTSAPSKPLPIDI